MSEEENRWGALYKRLRTGKTFLIVLSCFCAAWVAWNTAAFHWFPWLAIDDNGFGILTLILSVEASIGTSVLMAISERQDEKQQKQLDYMEDLLESQRDTLLILKSYFERSQKIGEE